MGLSYRKKLGPIRLSASKKGIRVGTSASCCGGCLFIPMFAAVCAALLVVAAKLW